MKTAIRTAVLALTLLLGTAAGTALAADPGGWSVERAPGGHEATWTSPEPLPVASDRPEILLDGVPVGPAAVSADGRQLSVTIPGIERPSVDRLAVRLSGRFLDGPEAEASTPPDVPWTAPARGLSKLEFDPGRKGPHRIRTDDYARRSWMYPGLRRRLEMKGHVVAPADPAVAAAGPLVLFLHGRHSSCYRPRPRVRFGEGWPCRNGAKPVPSDLGYDYLQRILASQGFVTVSIAANGINAQDDVLADGGANARAALIHRHLDLWAGWVSSGRRQADLGRTILIGHSRGGEGVNRAAEVIPLAAPYRIAGQVLLAPTNFARQSAAYIPTVTVLPYCDGDVSDLQGQAYTDNSIGLAPGDDSLKSSVVMFGANHNFFNTEWTPGISKARSDDDSWAPSRSLCGRRGKTRLSAAQQRRVAASYVAGAAQLMAGIDPRNLQLFDGSPVRVGPVTKAAVISQSVGGGKLTLVAGRDAKPSGDGPAAGFVCHGRAGGDGRRDCARHVDTELTPHWVPDRPAGLPTRPALAMSWRAPGRTARLGFGQELDLTAMAGLDLRTVVDPATRTARLGVALEDADGNRVELSPAAGGRVNAMPSGPGTQGRWLARTLRAPIPAAESEPFDLGRVTAVWIRGKGKPECGRDCSRVSRVRVLDISARPAGPLPALPDRRLPLVWLKPVVRAEGGPGRHLVRVPFTVSSALDAPARFRVIASGDTGIEAQPITVSLAPGQSSGTVEIPYRGDDAFDHGRMIDVEAFPIRGVIPASGSVKARLRNDDPEPRLKIRAVDRSIRAGQPARWRVSLDRPIAWTPMLSGRFGAVPGLPQLRLRELPRGWVERHTFGLPDDSDELPLSRVQAGVGFGRLSPRRSHVVAVPTRMIDGGPVRGIRLRLSVSGFRARLTPPIRIRPN